jgi:hypothetical protein
MTRKKQVEKPKSSGRVIAAGNNVLVRLVTHYITGHVVEVGEGYAILETAAWIADTGRWHDALKTGVLCEVEPCLDRVEIGLGAVVDAHPWRHALPTSQK